MATMRNLISAVAGFFLSASGVFAQNFAVSTNVVDYAEFGTMNLEASCGIARRLSVSAGIKYNPFSFGEGRNEKTDRQRTLEAGARFWPWHVFSGWWLGGKLKYQEFNRGGFVSQQTTEGDRYGGGLSGGYTFMLNPHLNLDIGLGVWTGLEKYTVYQCVRCGRTLDSGERIFVLPNDIQLSIAYIF